MRESDYECPMCGAIAWSGRAIPEGSGVPHKGHLKLSCSYDGHPEWAVDTRCPVCWMVPEYVKIMRGSINKYTVPALRCCGRTWTADEHESNPFADERAI